MILRVRERGGLRKVGHTTMASAKKPSLRGADGFKENLSRLNGYPKHYPMMVHTPISAGGHHGEVWVQNFFFLGHPPMTGRASRLAAAMPGSLSAAAYW